MFDLKRGFISLAQHDDATKLHFILICMLCENVENNPQYYEFKYSHYCDNGWGDIKSAYHKLNEYTYYMAVGKSSSSKILLQNC